MSHARDMLETTAAGAAFAVAEAAAAIEACLACEQTCTSCANACLAEEDLPDMRRCIALDAVCADLCGTTARVLSRPVLADHAVLEPLVRACVRACGACAEECERHAAHHRHCAICAEECRACEAACEALLEAAELG